MNVTFTQRAIDGVLLSTPIFKPVQQRCVGGNDKKKKPIKTMSLWRNGKKINHKCSGNHWAKKQNKQKKTDTYIKQVQIRGIILPLI